MLSIINLLKKKKILHSQKFKKNIYKKKKIIKKIVKIQFLETEYLEHLNDN